MSKAANFLTQQQEQQVINAILNAEKNTSGEIRVHIEKSTTKKTLDRAKEVFYYLKMDETKARNGVLFYLDIKDKKFAIFGDKGIHQKVPTDFWDSTKDIVLAEFKKNNFVHGLIQGINEAGKQLKAYFPYAKNTINELPNTVSKGI
ncbi:MAG: TPM domain-containing protein [Flavobacteriaceae bacterium]|nr:TPM domain-containing protein [Flavobacteriaceae bacterium]